MFEITSNGDLIVKRFTREQLDALLALEKKPKTKTKAKITRQDAWTEKELIEVASNLDQPLELLATAPVLSARTLQAIRVKHSKIKNAKSGTKYYRLKNKYAKTANR